MIQHGIINPESNRKTVLVVEDNELNREILTGILEEDGYTVLSAEDGLEGLEALSGHLRELSLVILDLFMPRCDGYSFLERVRGDELLSKVPVIVATGSENDEDEVRCLDLGAVDFVPKPYNPRVVLARARSVIRLTESVDALNAVEFEQTTGFYTLQALRHHIDRLMKSNHQVSYDLTIIHCCDLSLINGLMGKSMGDEVLKYVGGKCAELFPAALIGRKSDRFYLFYPTEAAMTPEQGRDAILSLIQTAPIPNVRLKAGFYEKADHSLSVSEIIDRAEMALGTIKDGFSTVVAGYDEKMHAKQTQERYLESRFEAALASEEFKVWYQPKVSTRTGKIEGAEALVRWLPADGKMISPGAFIPLFEEDGLIRRLDEYVFRRVCRFQHERIAAGLNVVPVSVNLSRNSMYYGDVLSRYIDILKEYQVPVSLVPIELTESAIMEGNKTDERVKQYTEAGFVLHMDDFGTGYSSMSSLISLPFGVLKIDKSVVDQINTGNGQMMIRHLIQIAHEMDVEVVAEGVESSGQVEYLKSVNCDLIQGYFYYKPMNGEAFSGLL